MKQLIEIDMDDNTKLYIETSGTQVPKNKDPMLMPVAAEKKVIRKAKDYLEKSFEQIRYFSNSVANSVKTSDLQPDEFEIEFAVKFANEAGVIISSISTESSIKIKLKWNKDKAV